MLDWFSLNSFNSANLVQNRKNTNVTLEDRTFLLNKSFKELNQINLPPKLITTSHEIPYLNLKVHSHYATATAFFKLCYMGVNGNLDISEKRTV